VDDCYAVESGANFSDHLPLALHSSSLPFSILNTPGGTAPKSIASIKQRGTGGIKILLSYYYATDIHLCNTCRPIDMSCVGELCQCSVGCRCDNVYQGIVEALHASSRVHCPASTDSLFKPYWDAEMSELKGHIHTCELWVSSVVCGSSGI